MADSNETKDKRINYARLEDERYNWVIRRINALLKEFSFTLYKLSKESDIPYSSLNNLYVRNTMPTIDTLERICSAFGISLSYFFAEQPVAADSKLGASERSVVETYTQLGYLINDSQESELLRKFRMLDDTDKARAEAYITGLAKLDK